MLYGILADGSIVTVDPKTGQATAKSKLSERLRPGTGDVRLQSGGRPSAPDELGRHQPAHQCRRRQGDRRRLAQVQGRRRECRQDPEGRRGRVLEFANPKPAATALYNIDATTWSLVSQAPPNDGVLNTIGSLGITAAARWRSTSWRPTGEKNDAWLVTGGDALYGRSEDRQGDAGRQARRRERQAHRHRLDRLNEWGVDRAVRCPPVNWMARIIRRPAAERSGPLCCAITPSLS